MTEAVPSTSQTAIHDIGYRHYEGERRGHRALAGVVFLHTLRTAYGLGRSARSKITPFLMLAVVSFPALVMVVVSSVTNATELPLEPTEYAMSLQPAISIYLAVLAPTAIAREMRFRVTSLYFSRPLGQADYLMAKFAATAAAMFVMVATPIVLLFFGSLLAKMPLGENLPDVVRALASALLLVLLLAAIGLAIAALAPRKGMGIAAIVAVMVVSAAVQGVLTGTGTDNGNAALELYGAIASPYTLVDGISAALFNAPSALPVQPDSLFEIGVFCASYCAIIGLCVGVLVLRFRRVSVL